MTFKFLIPGKLKDRYLQEGCQEYLKRLSKYGKMTLSFLPEEPVSPSMTKSQREKALQIEAKRALSQISEDDILFLVDIHGKELTTEEFASLMKEKMAKNGNFVFLFGSSFGLDDSLRKRANVSFSLSKLTFTHYMALYLTLEQCYRAMKILKGESYDK